MIAKSKIIGLFAAKPKPFFGTKSAIRKDSHDKLKVNMDSIDLDECFDKKHHGGSKRVIHHYSLKNYQHLKEAFPELAEKFVPGSYGENICTEDLDEKDLFVGDIVQIGEVKARLTIPRTPCSTIDKTYEEKGILKNIVQTGHYGWFYEIITPGIINVSDTFEVIERPFAKMSLHDLILQVGRKQEPNIDDLKELVESKILDDSWASKVRRVVGS